MQASRRYRFDVVWEVCFFIYDCLALYEFQLFLLIGYLFILGWRLISMKGGVLYV